MLESDFLQLLFVEWEWDFIFIAVYFQIFQNWMRRIQVIEILTDLLEFLYDLEWTALLVFYWLALTKFRLLNHLPQIVQVFKQLRNCKWKHLLSFVDLIYIGTKLSLGQAFYFAFLLIVLLQQINEIRYFINVVLCVLNIGLDKIFYIVLLRLFYGFGVLSILLWNFCWV